MTGRPRTADRILFLLGALFVAGYFLSLTRHALSRYFSPDDLMNLSVARTGPLTELVKANLLFFWAAPIPRPLGAAWYRSIYAVAGFNPAPFHAIYLMLMLANLYLTYSVSRRLSKSGTVGLLTALLMSYHGRFAALYVDTGLVYDVLCYFFYFSALLLYLRARQAGRNLTWREVAGGCLLYICALNSKEMAVTLPVLLGIYELVYHAAEPAKAMARWRFVVVSGAMTLVFAAGRLVGANSLTSLEVYRPRFTWARFMETSLGFADNLFCTFRWFTPPRLLVLWVALAALAWLTKSLVLRYGWLFAMLSPMPLAFVYPRGASQYYIPLYGWALYAAAAVGGGVELAFRQVGIRDTPWLARARGAAVCGGIALILYPYQKSVGMESDQVTVEQTKMRSITEQLHGLYPRLAPGTRLMFLNDPIDAEWVWDMGYIVQLSYRDDSLVVGRAKGRKDKPGAEELATYDHVLDYQNGRFIEVSPASP